MECSFGLDLPYKGSRDYLHGTDIHDALCDEVEAKIGGPLQRLDLVFHRMVRSALSAEVFESSAVPEAEPAVVFRFQARGQGWVAQLHETGGPVTRRSPYDEDAVLKVSTYDAERQFIESPVLPGYSNIEIIIPLFKDLLQRVLPDAKGKWLFTRLQLPESFRHATFARLGITFAGQSGMRLARGAMLGDGEKLGHIFFSLQPTE